MQIHNHGQKFKLCAIMKTQRKKGRKHTITAKSVVIMAPGLQGPTLLAVS